MSTIDTAHFVENFVRYADDHNACLETKNYSKRSRLNKKLMSMLAEIDTSSNASDIVSRIINSGNRYAIMWIANFAFKNKVCSEMVNDELIKIKNENRSVDSITAWALMNEYN